MKEIKDLIGTCKSSGYVIQAKLVNGIKIYEKMEDAFLHTGNIISFNYKSISDPDSEFASAGVVCKNDGQICKDFEVRFCCGK